MSLNPIISTNQVNFILNTDRVNEFSENCSYPLLRINDVESFRTKTKIGEIVKNGIKTMKNLQEERNLLGDSLIKSKEREKKERNEKNLEKRNRILIIRDQKLSHAKKMRSKRNNEYHGAGISGIILTVSVVGILFGVPLLFASDNARSSLFKWEKEVWILENAPESVEYDQVRKLAEKTIVEHQKSLAKIEYENEKNNKLMKNLFKKEEIKLENKKREIKVFINKHVYNS